MTNILDYSEWEFYSEFSFSELKMCLCCQMQHPTHKCHKLCKLPDCKKAFLTVPDGDVYHEFKTCPNRKICTRCGKGGHVIEDCIVPSCYLCGEIGHIQPKCEKFMMQITNSFEWYPQFHPQSMFVLKKVEREGYPKKWRHNPYSMTKNFVEVKN